MRIAPGICLAACTLLASGAALATTTEGGTTGAACQDSEATFADDVAFLRKHVEVIILSDASGAARVAVVPAYQGRVMTSTASGPGGLSFGWINREVIERGERQPHMTAFGGEDRFWLGPEGGQYAIYFEQDAPFDFAHWQVPEPLDWGGWEVAAREPTQVRLRKNMRLVNYAGTTFDLRVDRTVRLLDRGALARHLGQAPEDSVQAVAYESLNIIRNLGTRVWSKESGLLSVWILGMYNPSPETTVVIPFQAGPESELGPVVNDAYFGKVPADRLVVGDGVLFFRADGKQRGKIGIPRPRAKATVGSYDAANRVLLLLDRSVLTLVQYTLPETATDYVNSIWEIQQAPYRGDVVNSYNDGPPAPGSPPLGPFYELETSSPAAALKPGERLTHVHRTLHLGGSVEALDAVARGVLGVGLSQITGAFGEGE